jgi:hypothetical protein
MTKYVNSYSVITLRDCDNDVYHELSHSRILHFSPTVYICILCVLLRITDESPEY